MRNLTALKFVAQIGGVKGTSWYQVWHKAENWYRSGLTIESQTFCGLNKLY